MKALVKGKKAVLAYLETDAGRRTGNCSKGSYALMESEGGCMVALIAGRCFIAACGHIHLADTKGKPLSTRIKHGLVTALK